MKKFLSILLILLAIPFVLALFVKSSYQVEATIQINLPKDSVYNFIKYLKNQDLFSKWAKIDTLMQKTYHGTDAQIGFIAAWKSTNKQVGTGEQEIIRISPNRIDYALRFKEPFQANEKAYIQIDSLSPSATNVKWGFNGKMNYPMNLLLLFVNFEKEISKDFNEGLVNLKTLLEPTPSSTK